MPYQHENMGSFQISIGLRFHYCGFGVNNTQKCCYTSGHISLKNKDNYFYSKLGSKLAFNQKKGTVSLILTGVVKSIIMTYY